MLILKAIAHETIWGGVRLKKYTSENVKKVGHLYSVFCRENISNQILNGEYAGKTLNEVFPALKKEYDMEAYDFFPLTIALVDAADHLSIQVHPDELCAFELEGASRGKRESWYFLNAPDSGYIFNGSKKNTKEQIRSEIENQTMNLIADTLEVKAGDYVFVEPGTLHALTAGCMVYEIEEGSDYTYRFYDFDRQDAMGNKRKLHINQAMKAVRPDLKSAVRRYPKDGIIDEETYSTHFMENVKEYRNMSSGIECFTIIKGSADCGGMTVGSGMTILLFPNEMIHNADIETVIIAGLNKEDK